MSRKKLDFNAPFFPQTVDASYGGLWNFYGSLMESPMSVLCKSHRNVFRSAADLNSICGELCGIQWKLNRIISVLDLFVLLLH